MARKLSALSGFYDYGVHDAKVLTYSPAAPVRRPKVSDESQAVGLTADELGRLLSYLDLKKWGVSNAKTAADEGK